MTRKFTTGIGEAPQQSSSPGAVRSGQARQLSQGDPLVSTLQSNPDGDKGNTVLQTREPPRVNTGIVPQVFSQHSVDGPFETFFHDFEFEAIPFYNFWTNDESTNDQDILGNRKLSEVPRFVKLVWKTAPEIEDPEFAPPSPGITVRPTTAVVVSRDNERKQSFLVKGMIFAPEHLQPSGFSTAKAVSANGHVAPGVIEAVVEVPLKNVAASNTSQRFDEDSFLADQSTAGISPNELIAQGMQASDGLSNTTAGKTSGDDQSRSLVDGKFSFEKSSDRKSVGTNSIHSSSPALSISAATAQSSRQERNDHTRSMNDDFVPVEKETRNASIKVKFVDQSIGGIASSQKVNLMSAPEHAENMAALGSNLGNLEILSRADTRNVNRVGIPSLPTPRLKRLEYVGYVIEKYVRKGSGAFIKVEEIDIPNKDTDEYIDTKIAYGQTYRYRIKSIIRWTRSARDSDTVIDQTVREMFGSQTTPLASYKSSYFSSEWSKNWCYATIIDQVPPPPPDEIVVRPDSARKRIVVTMKFPDDSQRDLSQMILLRKLQDVHGRDLTGWKVMARFPPQNCIFFDRDVENFQESSVRYAYCGQTLSKHGEESVLSEQIAARLNADFRVRGEYLTEFVSSPGVRREYFGAFATIPPKTTASEIVIVPEVLNSGEERRVGSFVISGRDALGKAVLNDTDYICRIESLDTGEKFDIPFSLEIDTVPSEVKVSSNTFVAGVPDAPPKTAADHGFGKKIVDEADRGESQPADKPSKGETWKR